MQMSRPVVEVTGEFDLSTAAGWEGDVEAVGRNATVVVLDLSDVRFVDSAGVRILFRLVRNAESNGTHVFLVAPQAGPVRRLLDILAMDSVTPVCETRTEALRLPYTGRPHERKESREGPALSE
jgi:anti-anti-sigma factor